MNISRRKKLLILIPLLLAFCFVGYLIFVVIRTIPNRYPIVPFRSPATGISFQYPLGLWERSLESENTTTLYRGRENNADALMIIFVVSNDELDYSSSDGLLAKIDDADALTTCINRQIEDYTHPIYETSSFCLNNESSPELPLEVVTLTGTLRTAYVVYSQLKPSREKQWEEVEAIISSIVIE